MRLWLAAGALLLALPLVTLCVRVEFPVGKTHLTIRTIRDPFAGGQAAFRHGSEWSVGDGVTDLCALRTADWEYRFWRSKRVA